MDSLLSRCNSLDDLKRMSISELRELCSDLRDFIIEHTLRSGGHLGVSLGVIELTVALHRVFNSPIDRIVWDIGHQAYAHKILTDRKSDFPSIRGENGISGFCLRSESKHDIFGAGHAGTAIAAALGIAVAKNRSGVTDGDIISVVGDGALSVGMCFEALNNISMLNQRSIVILNDNDASISPSIGGMREHLCKLRSRNKFTKGEMDLHIQKALDGIGESNIFTDLGCKYIGVVDGHDVELMVELLGKIKDSQFDGTVLLHTETEKGRGYEPAKKALDKMHSVNPYSLDKKKAKAFTCTHCFASSMISAMEIDDSICSISAAMTIGTGLQLVQEKFPDRVFDVGIAEQFAVTFSAGMAVEGVKPFCAIYSTFLQRGYDQVVHDVAVQSLPVRFIIDRAGYVGGDGPTHNGAFDLAYLRVLPNFVIMSPSNGLELIRMLKTVSQINDKPSAIRYCRSQNASDAIDIAWSDVEPIEIGKSKVLQEGSECCIIALGNMVANAMDAADVLEREHNIKPTVVDARFVKPLDYDLIRRMSDLHPVIISIEDGSIGGIGSAIVEFLTSISYRGVVQTLCHPDKFLPHADVSLLHKWASIDPNAIVSALYRVCKK